MKTLPNTDPIRPMLVAALRNRVGDNQAIVESIKGNSDRTKFQASVRQYTPARPPRACGSYIRHGILKVNCDELLQA